MDLVFRCGGYIYLIRQCKKNSETYFTFIVIVLKYISKSGQNCLSPQRNLKFSLGALKALPVSFLMIVTSENETLGIIYSLFRGKQNIFLTIFSSKFVVKCATKTLKIS